MSRLGRLCLRGALVAIGATALSAQEAQQPLRHNPFNRPASMVALGSAAAPAPTPVELELRATLVANGVAFANIDGEILAVGQSHAGYRVVRIEEGRAVVVKDGERLVLDVYARQLGADERSR